MPQVVSESRLALAGSVVDPPGHVRSNMLVVSIELLVARQEETNLGGSFRTTLRMKRVYISSEKAGNSLCGCLCDRLY